MQLLQVCEGMKPFHCINLIVSQVPANEQFTTNRQFSTFLAVKVFEGLHTISVVECKPLGFLSFSACSAANAVFPGSLLAPDPQFFRFHSHTSKEL